MRGYADGLNDGIQEVLCDFERYMEKGEPMSDLISRQVAIDKLWGEREKLDSYMDECLKKKLFALRSGTKAERNRIEEDIEIITRLPSAQPEQRWIQCSERLPEKEGWYITTVESEKTGKRRIENDLFAVDIALAHGHTPNKFCKDGYRQRTVAWMPFPEPYKGR